MKTEQSVVLETTKEDGMDNNKSISADLNQREERQPVKATRTFIPRVDIYQTNTETIVLVEMPGVDEGDADITLDKDILTIRGEAAFQNPAQYRWVHREYAIGKFERAFTLTDTIDRDQISAEMKNGLLRLTLPKVEAARPKKITVKA